MGTIREIFGLVSHTRTMAAVLVAIGIVAAPVPVGSVAPCTPHDGACTVMAGPLGTSAENAMPAVCACPTADEAPCCAVDNGFPGQSADRQPPERTGINAPPSGDGESVAVRACGADKRRHHLTAGRFQWRAPPPLADLLHQCFLI